MMVLFRNSIVFLVLLVPLLAGCEEDVVAVLGTDVPYSLWGVLNPLADTQFVRVFPVERTLDPGVPAPLDARFTSVDLGTGDEHVWRDSVFVDALGAVGHVFYAPFQVAWGHDYRLEIRRADGATSWVEVEIPRRTTLFLNPPDTTQSVILSAFLQGTPEHLVKVSLTVTVEKEYVFEIPFNGSEFRRDDGWAFDINLSHTFLIVRDSMRSLLHTNVQHVTLYLLQFTVVVGTDEWTPPGGVFDSLALVQPGAMENVQNGFGFITGGYTMSLPWTLPFDVVAKSGFTPACDPNSRLCPQPDPR